jgi:hypothetical protein
MIPPFQQPQAVDLSFNHLAQPLNLTQNLEVLDKVAKVLSSDPVHIANQKRLVYLNDLAKVKNRLPCNFTKQVEGVYIFELKTSEFCLELAFNPQEQTVTFNGSDFTHLSQYPEFDSLLQKATKPAVRSDMIREAFGFLEPHLQLTSNESREQLNEKIFNFLEAKACLNLLRVDRTFVTDNGWTDFEIRITDINQQSIVISKGPQRIKSQVINISLDRPGVRFPSLTKLLKHHKGSAEEVQRKLHQACFTAPSQSHHTH